MDNDAEAVVIDPKGVVLYQGRIDNRYFGLGVRWGSVTEFYLRDALDATLGGKRPTVAQTEAVGCLIE